MSGSLSGKARGTGSGNLQAWHQRSCHPLYLGRAPSLPLLPGPWLWSSCSLLLTSGIGWLRSSMLSLRPGDHESWRSQRPVFFGASCLLDNEGENQGHPCHSDRWDRVRPKIQVLPLVCSCPPPSIQVGMVKLQALSSKKGFQVKDWRPGVCPTPQPGNSSPGGQETHSKVTTSMTFYHRARD